MLEVCVVVVVAFLSVSLVVMTSSSTDTNADIRKRRTALEMSDEEWQRLRRDVLAFARRRLHSDAEAEDVTQRALLKLTEQREVFCTLEQAFAWAYRVARNLVIDHYRATVRRPLVSLDSVAEPATSEDDPASAPDSAQALATCLPSLTRTLPPPDQEALSLDASGERQVAVARRLGVSVSTVKSRVQRARRRLRHAVEHCCRVDVDARGRVMAHEKRASTCPCGHGCGCAKA